MLFSSRVMGTVRVGGLSFDSCGPPLRGYTLADVPWLGETTSPAIGDSAMKDFLFGAAALHASFLAAELLPWSRPLLLQKASENLRPLAEVTKDQLSPEAKFTDEQQKLL